MQDADLQFAKSLQAELNDNDSDLDRSLQFVYPGSQQQPPAKVSALGRRRVTDYKPTLPPAD